MKLIRGINRDTISMITVTEAKRIGQHPYYTKLHRKWMKKNFLYLFLDEIDEFTFFFPASVNIHGSDGGVLEKIRCRSNEQAYELKKELMKEMMK